MNQVTINPIARLLQKNPAKTTFRWGDIAQLVQRLTREREKKLNNPRQKHSAGQEEKYLEILQHLHTEFKKKPELPRAGNYHPGR